jgi:hypothetical protein
MHTVIIVFITVQNQSAPSQMTNMHAYMPQNEAGSLRLSEAKHLLPCDVCRSDFREACPDLFSFEALWSAVFCIIPVGVPFFMILILWWHKVSFQRIACIR